MEKRFTAGTDDNSLSEAPDKKTRLILVSVSGVLVLVIGIAAAIAAAAGNKAKTDLRVTTDQTQQASDTDPADAPVTKFGAEYPEGTVPTDCMSLEWGMLPAEIKIKFPDVINESPSALSEEGNTVNLTYSRKTEVGGFAFSRVMLSVDKYDGLYAFSYFLGKEKYSEVLAALTEEYGKPIYKSGESAYWELEDRILLNLTVRISDIDSKDYSFLQYINTKEPKATVKPDVSPDIKLGMTSDDARKKISMNKIHTSIDGTETYMSEKRYDFSSDGNLGKFAVANASAVILNFDPKADLISYSFIMRGDHLYEIREKIAKEFGNPAVNCDYASEWNAPDGKSSISVAFGRMTGSGRGFATELRYKISPEEYEVRKLVKAVGRAARKGKTYAEVKEELGKYGPADKVNKGSGTLTFINKYNVDITVFGMRIVSVDIEFAKNAVTDIYYVFEGTAYQTLKKNIESNYGPGETKLNYKDRIHRVQWKPEAAENGNFTRIMLDYVNLKINPKARVHYYS